MDVIGYTDRWSFGAGEAVAIKASSSTPFLTARLLRCKGAVRTPADWLTATEPVVGVEPVTFAAEWNGHRAGSYLEIQLNPEIAAPELSFSVDLQPTDLPQQGSSVLTLVGEDGQLSLLADGDGQLTLSYVYDGGFDSLVLVGAVLVPGRWQCVSIRLNTPDLTGEVSVSPLAGNGAAMRATFVLEAGMATFRPGILLVGAKWREGAPLAGLDAKIHAPKLTLGAGDGLAARRSELAFAFEAGPCAPSTVEQISGPSSDAKLVNAPQRCFGPGRRHWSDAGLRRAPAYDAVWLHRDDIEDFGWPDSAVVTLPADANGVYVVLLSAAGGDVDWADRASFDAVPVFACGGGSKNAQIALVLPTYSYRAYANNTFAAEADRNVFKLAGPTVSAPYYDYAIKAGLKSLYCSHSDGAGVALASLKRPQTSVRADFTSQLHGIAHQFSADLEIVEWLERIGVDYQIVTDEYLEANGSAAIEDCAVVLTGSHPEYVSPGVRSAFSDYAERGGSLIYMGGNGFYWTVATHPDAQHMLEIRRHDGVRTWTSPDGEDWHQLDGRRGGLWQRLGAPPDQLFGIGFSAHGFCGDGQYKVNREALDANLTPRIYEFLKEHREQEFGIAGLEVDARNSRHAPGFDVIALATTSGLPEGYVPAVEDVAGLDALLTDPMAQLASLVKGEIALSHLPGGGLCVAMGSIRWASGLNAEGDPKSVSAFTEAALRDLLDHAAARRTGAMSFGEAAN